MTKKKEKLKKTKNTNKSLQIEIIEKRKESKTMMLIILNIIMVISSRMEKEIHQITAHKPILIIKELSCMT